MNCCEVADGFDGGKNFLANAGKLAGEIKHRNRLGVCVGTSAMVYRCGDANGCAAITV